MSESEHTPEPWITEPGGGRGAWIKGANGEWAALACGDTDQSASNNARRILACVNACKDIPTDWLEKVISQRGRGGGRLLDCLGDVDQEDIAKMRGGK